MEAKGGSSSAARKIQQASLHYPNPAAPAHSRCIPPRGEGLQQVLQSAKQGREWIKERKRMWDDDVLLPQSSRARGAQSREKISIPIPYIITQNQ